MAETEPNFVISDPDPDYPGWNSWVLTDPDCYNSFLGRMIVRRGGDGVGENIARVRMFPERKHRNLGDAVHRRLGVHTIQHRAIHQGNIF